MRTPIERGIRETAARTASRAVARQQYRMGKAFPRILYFETQRGLSLTQLEDGHVRTGRQQPTRPGGKGRTSARAAAGPRAPYRAATKAKARLAPNFAASVNLPVWREVGPTRIPRGQTYGTGGNNRPPVSGRCVGIVIDPGNRRRLVLCTAGGGLWRSDDSGATWRPLTDAQPTLSMGAIAAAPSSPNIVYAGTGEGDTRSALGLGLLRSADAGLSWTLVSSGELSGTAIYDLAVDPTDPTHLWIGAVAGLFESRNGGASVRAVRSGLTWSVSIHRGRPREIFVATDLGLFRSSNAGASWSRVNLPGGPAAAELSRMEVCHAPPNPDVVYVAAATDDSVFLWRRASATGSFASQAVPSRMNASQAWYDWCFAVSPRDANLVYWGAIELYRGKRSAGGWRWRNISSRSSGDSIHPDQHHLAFDPSDSRTLYVCNDGGLFRSPDEGTSWTSLNPGLGITEFEFLAQLESDGAWLIGGTQDNGTLNNAGSRLWDQVALGDGGDCGAADGASPLCFHSYYDMWIERAKAKGPGAFRWADASPPFPNGYAALFYPPMDLRGPILTKAGQSVYVSTNSGRAGTWSEVLLPTSGDAAPDVASAITIVGTTRIFVGTAKGRLYRITRAISGWGNARVESWSSPRRAFMSDIVALDAAGQSLWISFSTFGQGHVYRSTNGGVSWSNRSGNLPNIPVNAIVVDPANDRHVYAATDNGVYRTSNAGASWADFSNGLPNAVVGDLILHEKLRLLRAGTRNRGAWEVKV